MTPRDFIQQSLLCPSLDEPACGAFSLSIGDILTLGFHYAGLARRYMFDNDMGRAEVCGTRSKMYMEAAKDMQPDLVRDVEQLIQAQINADTFVPFMTKKSVRRT